MMLRSISLVLLVLLISFESRGEEARYLLKEVRSPALVHRGVNRQSAVIAKIQPGAVVDVSLRARTEDCPKGWFERRLGGFICGRYLTKTKAAEARPAEGDRPDIRAGLFGIVVRENDIPLYKKLWHVGRRGPKIRLLKGSVLTVRGEVSSRNERYYETREGMFILAEGTERLPDAVPSLGVEAGDEDRVRAIVTGRNTQIHADADTRSAVTGTLERWSVIRTGAPLARRDGFVALPDEGYVDDAAVARVREAPMPKGVTGSERWIAVDIEEQLLLAYEGAQLMRVIPCSTGKRGNTHKGAYRIQKKLRRQHMHLRMNRVRVEDVQWVMYYDKEDAIAIHSAYWHDDFGTPVSHGCVNLPPEDARWLFEWSEPVALPTDSVRFPLPRDSGTRVIVF